jgi:endonuclease/exonuclease/phosphatase family metal-dependent hydrolase
LRSLSSHVARPPARRGRRGVARALAAGLATGVSLAALVLTGTPASAATPISLRAVGGDGQVTASWSPVRGARSYTLRWGVGTSTSHAWRTARTTMRINGLSDHLAYSIQVTADGLSAGSSRVTARPTPGVPTAVSSIRAVPDGANRIRVTWRGGATARSVAVLAGADSTTGTHPFDSGWHPAAIQSLTLTVPSSLRDVLGGGSGNVVFVRVALTNSTRSSPRIEHASDSATRFRLSPTGTWSLAGSAANAAAVTPLSVASWNVQSVTATVPFGAADQWGARMPRVVANIESLHPALVGLQELTTARIVRGCLNPHGQYTCVEQYQTLQTALGTRSSTVPVVYRNVREDANAYVYQQAALGDTQNYVDSALFYDPAELDVLESGFISPRALLGAAWPATMTDEAGIWAVFRTVAGPGRPARSFLAASIHMPAGATAAVSAVRRAEGAAVAGFLDRTAKRTDGSTLPIVLTGDFNAYGALDDSAPSLRLRHDGFTDAAATTNRTGWFYSTSNGTNGSDGADPGYPRHAVSHPHPTSRIDYIMLKLATTSQYRNEVRFAPGSVQRLFDTRYQGSDHNLQLARVGIAAPTAPNP